MNNKQKTFRNDDEIKSTILRSYFSFFQRRKAANSNLFKGFLMQKKWKRASKMADFISSSFRVALVSILCLYFFAGCLPAPFFQKESAIPKNAWSYTFKPSFKFDITDSNAMYRPFFII